MSEGCVVQSKGRPSHGPLGETTVGDDGRWRVRLTAEGRRVAAEIMARHPNPVVLLRAKSPGLYRRARKLRMTDEEINAVCMLGVVHGIARHDPKRGAVSTAVALWIWGTVVKEVRGPTRWAKWEVVPQVDGDDGESFDFFSGVPAKPTDPSGESPAEELDSMVSRADLPPRGREAVAALRAESLSTRELGERLGVAKEAAVQLRAMVIESLRAASGEPTRGEREGAVLAARHGADAVAFLAGAGRPRNMFVRWARDRGLMPRAAGWLLDALVADGRVQVAADAGGRQCSRYRAARA